MKNRTYQDLSEFKKRRAEVAKKHSGAAIILFSGNEGHWERFRAKSDFVYMTGFEEPESIAVLLPGQKKSFHLFVRPRDPAKEIWDGYRYGLEGAKSIFGADESYDSAVFYDELPKLLMDVDRVYVSLEGQERDLHVVRSIQNFITNMGRSGRGNLTIHDPKEIIGEMRVIKSAQEIQWLKEACRISGISHRNVMSQVKSGMKEREVQALLFKEFYAQDAMREGYFSIIAAGANATILHYRDNNCDSKPGDMLLIDAGAEKYYYTADITRAFPMNGKFSPAQADLYSRVLKVQKNLCSMVKPGVAYEAIQEAARRQLTEQLIELKWLKGTVDENIASGAYRKYYPHNIGHFLGMDVHDTGLYRVNNKSRLLEAGMTLTIEPGLYVPEHDDVAPVEFRGIGIRIEDDILVTAQGHEVMTSLAPKEIADIESVMAEKRILAYT